MRQNPSLSVELGTVETSTIDTAPAGSTGQAGALRWGMRPSLGNPRAAVILRLIVRYGPPLPLAGVLAVYILAAFIIPTLAPVSISDDWTYVRSVEILHDTGRVDVLPVAAAAVVFQTLWAGLFTLIFGLSFGVIRLATVSLMFFSGVAMYGICRELGADQRRSALGAAVYLFNPLAFVLGYTFMSDPYFTAVMTISLYFLARGLQPENPRPISITFGSIVAGCAFLVRVHGLLIPLGAIIYLAVTGRLRFDRASARLLAQVAAAPVVTALWYYLIFARGVPRQQDLFWSQAKDAWFDEAWLLVQRLTFIELMFGGFFALPLALAALTAGRAGLRFRWKPAWAIFALWALVIALGQRYFLDPHTRLLDEDRRVMPYIPHFLGRAGLGAGDLRNARPAIAADWLWNWFTGVCVVTSLVMGVVLARRVKPGSPRGGGVAGFIVTVGILQAGGVVPQSLLFRNWVISLDRYLLPLLPFTVALVIWALKDLRLNLIVGWVAVAIMAAYSIAGTRDSLVFHRNIWRMAEFANSLGIPNQRLDAGYAWDAYHLWEYSDANGIPPQTPWPYGTWWTDVYAPATDSSYIVSGGPVEGYSPLWSVEYSQWLQQEPTTLYLMRRNDVAGPP